MATSGSSGSWSGFAKTVLIPLFIALALYLSIFQAILPLYRRYRSHIARYSAYTPLTSGFAAQTSSWFNPIIEPSRSLWNRARSGVHMMLWRWAVPGVQHMDLEHRSANYDDEDAYIGEEMRGTRRIADDDHDGLAFSDDDDDDDDTDEESVHPNHVTRVHDSTDDERVLFDDYTAGNMTGFDVRGSSGDGRRFGLGRRRAQSQTQDQDQIRPPSTRRTQITQRLGMERRRIGGEPIPPDEQQMSIEHRQGGGMDVNVDLDDSNRRLSRELEEGFRDDSSQSEDEFEHGVTVGRKSLGRR